MILTQGNTKAGGITHSGLGRWKGLILYTMFKHKTGQMEMFLLTTHLARMMTFLHSECLIVEILANVSSTKLNKI